MSIKKISRVILIIGVGGAALFAALFFSRPAILKKEGSVDGGREAALGWKKDFVHLPGSSERSLPKGWMLKNKPGTKPAEFYVESDEENKVSFLHMRADKASASLITSVDGVDLKKTPFLRWRWRAKTLPEGADGRVRSKDDQAIGIYVGAGSVLNGKSVSYRWDTETPKETEGYCAYVLGLVKVKWHTLRNKEDAGKGLWFIEERNVAEDFKKAWGFYPKEIYLSVSCNSQYTTSQAAADLGWIEFTSLRR